MSEEQAPWLDNKSFQSNILRETARLDDLRRTNTGIPSAVPSLLDMVNQKQQENLQRYGQQPQPQQQYAQPQSQYQQPHQQPQQQSQYQQPQQQSQYQQPQQQYAQPQSSVEPILLGALQAINNTLDKKFLSEGTVFLVCIDRSGVKPDTDPAAMPTVLANSPNSDIKIVAYKEFTTESELNTILSGYNTAVQQFAANSAQNPNASHYNIFIGRLVEEITYNTTIDYKI